LVWIWAGAVLAAVYWPVAARLAAPSLRMAVVKAAAVGVLVPGALALGAPPAVVAGLALGAAGDFALARPGARWFLAGMAAFAAGHLAYLAAFAVMGAGGPPVWLAVALAVLGGSTELWLAPRTGDLRGPVRGYVGVIVAMALAAGGLPPGHGPAQAGVALFVASDLLLALERFVLRDGVWRRRCAVLLWPLYWGGQALILWGALPPAAPSA
jgi:uncharacterized membrane protein YhhN